MIPKQGSGTINASGPHPAATPGMKPETARMSPFPAFAGSICQTSFFFTDFDFPSCEFMMTAYIGTAG